MTTPMRQDTRLPADPGFRPLSGRRRLLIALLAVATAFAVVMTLLDPPGGVRRQHLQRVDAPLCSASTAGDCVGGKVDVLPEPAPSAATSVPAVSAASTAVR